MRSDSFSFCSTNSVIYSSHQLCHLFHQLCHLFKLENLVSLLPTQLDVSGHGGPLVSPAPSGLKLTRGAFFSRGSGVFHGTLNPLSSRSIIVCTEIFTVRHTHWQIYNVTYTEGNFAHIRSLVLHYVLLLNN